MQAPSLTNLREFDQFILDHERLPVHEWNEPRVRVLAKACEDRLASEGGREPGKMVARAFSRALFAGFSIPPVVAGYLLASGHGKTLKKWVQAYPGQVPSLSDAATQPLSSREYQGESPEWTTALHRLAGTTPSLPHYQASLELALKEGADPSTLDSQGKSALFAARKIPAARALLRAGAPLAMDSRALHSLSRVMSGFSSAGASEKGEFVQSIAQSVSQEDHAGVIFAAAAKGEFSLVERLRSTWGLSGEDIEQMSVETPAPTGTMKWSWPGWLAYHGILGIHESPFIKLADCIRKMVKGTLPLGDDWNQMWVAVAAHHALYERTKAQGGEALLEALSSPHAGPDFQLVSPELRRRIQMREDLPLSRGGLIRYRALRAWLMAGLEGDLKGPSPSQGSWSLTQRFLLEDLQAQERMPVSDYKKAQEMVLEAAIKTDPEGHGAPPWTALALALVRAFERALKEGSFPGWVQVKVRNLDFPFEEWFSPEHVGKGANSQEWDAITQAIEGLVNNEEGELGELFSGATEGRKWRWVFRHMAQACLSHRLDQELPPAMEGPLPQRRVRL